MRRKGEELPTVEEVENTVQSNSSREDGFHYSDDDDESSKEENSDEVEHVDSSTRSNDSDNESDVEVETNTKAPDNTVDSQITPQSKIKAFLGHAYIGLQIVALPIAATAAYLWYTGAAVSIATVAGARLPIFNLSSTMKAHIAGIWLLDFNLECMRHVLYWENSFIHLCIQEQAYLSDHNYRVLFTIISIGTAAYSYCALGVTAPAAICIFLSEVLVAQAATLATYRKYEACFGKIANTLVNTVANTLSPQMRQEQGQDQEQKLEKIGEAIIKECKLNETDISKQNLANIARLANYDMKLTQATFISTINEHTLKAVNSDLALDCEDYDSAKNIVMECLIKISKESDNDELSEKRSFNDNLNIFFNGFDKAFSNVVVVDSPKRLVARQANVSEQPSTLGIRS